MPLLPRHLHLHKTEALGRVSTLVIARHHPPAFMLPSPCHSTVHAPPSFPILLDSKAHHPPLPKLAGMCLLDTIDGALMLTLYTSTSLAKDPLAILYYSAILTFVTVLVALVVGVIQLLSLVLNVAEPTGPFWDGVSVAGDHYDVIGELVPSARLTKVNLWRWTL